MLVLPVQFRLVTGFKRIHLYYKLFLYGSFPKQRFHFRGLLFKWLLIKVF